MGTKSESATPETRAEAETTPVADGAEAEARAVVAQADGVTTPADDGTTGDGDAVVKEAERPGRLNRIRKWFRVSPFRRMMAWIVGLALLTGAGMKAMELYAPIWWDDVYSTLLSWQTGIGAFLGLGALMLAALYNAELNRRRDKELTEEKRRDLANALAAEFEALQAHGQESRRYLLAMLKKYGGVRPTTLISAARVRMPVCDRLLGDLGLLPRHIARNVITTRQFLFANVEAFEAIAVLGSATVDDSQLAPAAADNDRLQFAVNMLIAMDERCGPMHLALSRVAERGEIVPKTELRQWINDATERYNRRKVTTVNDINAAIAKRHATKAEATPPNDNPT